MIASRTVRTMERTEQDIIRLCHAGLDARQLRIEVFARLRTSVPYAMFWCATLDPDTLLFTNGVMDGGTPQDALPFITNEILQDDFNKITELARSRQPVNSLHVATRGELDRSRRHREIHEPLGLGDELRAVFRTGQSAWGVTCLHRAHGDPVFSPDELSLVRRIAPHLAQGLRDALLLEAVDVAPPESGPGLLVLADDLSIIATTPAAERWLADVMDEPGGRLPFAIHGIVARLRALERGASPTPDAMPRARFRTRAGEWLVAHASWLSGGNAEARIAVILERARPAEVTPLILLAYGLTAREAEIAGLVLRGASTDEIATALTISALTVQQHLKAIFDKTGVRSRRELVGQIFSQHYWPSLSLSLGAPADSSPFI